MPGHMVESGVLLLSRRESVGDPEGAEGRRVEPREVGAPHATSEATFAKSPVDHLMASPRTAWLESSAEVESVRRVPPRRRWPRDLARGQTTRYDPPHRPAPKGA